MLVLSYRLAPRTCSIHSVVTRFLPLFRSLIQAHSYNPIFRTLWFTLQFRFVRLEMARSTLKNTSTNGAHSQQVCVLLGWFTRVIQIVPSVWFALHYMLCRFFWLAIDSCSFAYSGSLTLNERSALMTQDAGFLHNCFAWCASFDGAVWIHLEFVHCKQCAWGSLMRSTTPLMWLDASQALRLR